MSADHKAAKTRVMCCGTFDLLHPGHRSFLQQAASLGDELVVVVARDANVQRIKGRLPAQDEETRRANIAALDLVAQAHLGYPGNDFLRIVAELQPQIIALGYDQRPPPGLAAAFPHCLIKTLEPFHPEKYKTSFFRQRQEGGT